MEKGKIDITQFHIYLSFNGVRKRAVILPDTENTILDIFDQLYGVDGIDSIEKNNSKNLYFTYDNKLISPDTFISELIFSNDSGTSNQSSSVNTVKTIECFQSIPGGGPFDDILDGLLSFFNPIVQPIVAIGNVFIFILQLLIWLAKFIFWFIFFVYWLVTDLLNPVKLMTDFWNSIILIILTVLELIISIPRALAAYVVNGIGGWMQGFFGWDQSNLTARDRASKYFQEMDRTAGKKCYLTNTNTVPFSIILGTIICPPLGVFMDLGVSGWMNIFICGLLTLCFYLPGLLYALLVIYS